MFNILYAQESAVRKSIPFKTGETITEGAWVVFDSGTGKLKVQAGAYDVLTEGAAFPVYGGNVTRLDSKEMGVVTVCLGRSFVAETDQVQAVSINIGDPLTILDGKLTKADLTPTTGNAAHQDIVGYCTKPPTNGVIEFTRA